jgi:hypothetical protein
MNASERACLQHLAASAPAPGLTSRNHQRTDAESLVRRGLLERVDVYLPNTRIHRRTGYQLTNSGRIALDLVRDDR